MKRLAVFHLLNDFSGSPKVLKSVLQGLLDKGYNVDLYTSIGGALDAMSHPGLTRHSYSYNFSSNGIITLVRYALIQILTFIKALRYAFNTNTSFYINTILPVGPALAGKLMGKKVVYHYHENAHIKSRFYRMLASVMEKLADEIICVSEYQSSFLKRKRNVTVIPNALPLDFISRLIPNTEAAFKRKSVLMLSSLKGYKGTSTFLEIASQLTQFKFILVINDTKEDIDRWIESEHIKVTDNVEIYPRAADVTQYYNKASLVVNLSNPDLFIETFGLTALEAMTAGLPVIVPLVGGIAEMVENGINGYKIDCKDNKRLLSTISDILTDRARYFKLSANSLMISQKFDVNSSVKKISELL